MEFNPDVQDPNIQSDCFAAANNQLCNSCKIVECSDVYLFAIDCENLFPGISTADLDACAPDYYVGTPFEFIIPFFGIPQTAPMAPPTAAPVAPPVAEPVAPPVMVVAPPMMEPIMEPVAPPVAPPTSGSVVASFGTSLLLVAIGWRIAA